MSAIFKNLGKLNAILLLSAAVTLALFHAMQTLIMSEDAVPMGKAVTALPKITLPDIKFEPRVETPKPEKVETPPEVPEIEFRKGANTQPVAMNFSGLESIAPDGVDTFSLSGPADASAMPVAQIQPVYPSRAVARGIEGFVLVQFDVSETGAVINPQVLVSQPSSIFDSAALRAVSRWKYQPKVIDGKAVRMFGLQTRFNFNLRE